MGAGSPRSCGGELLREDQAERCFCLYPAGAPYVPVPPEYMSEPDLAQYFRLGLLDGYRRDGEGMAAAAASLVAVPPYMAGLHAGLVERERRLVTATLNRVLASAEGAALAEVQSLERSAAA